MVILEQLFWGNDGGGYRVLGSSKFIHQEMFERIRDQLGTPDGLSQRNPFLLSVPGGNTLMMFCCQCGKPDNYGRKTIFIHALTGDRTACNTHHVNAFSLWRGGYFKAECPSGLPLDPLTLPPLPESANLQEKIAPEIPWDGSKLAISSNSPPNELICQMLGEKINDFPWAGFTWKPLDDFQLYAISTYAIQPTDRPSIILKQDGSFERREVSPPPLTVDAPKKENKKMRSPFAAWVLLGLLVISLGANCWLISRPIQTIASERTEQAIGLPSANQESDPPPVEDIFDWYSEIKKTKDVGDMLKSVDGCGYQTEDIDFLKALRSYFERQKGKKQK